MPIYVLTCIKCGETQEILASYEKLSEIESNLRCNKCGNNMKHKLVSFVSHFNYTKGGKDG